MRVNRPFIVAVSIFTQLLFDFLQWFCYCVANAKIKFFQYTFVEIFLNHYSRTVFQLTVSIYFTSLAGVYFDLHSLIISIVGTNN